MKKNLLRLLTLLTGVAIITAGLFGLTRYASSTGLRCPAATTPSGAAPPLGGRQFCTLNGTLKHGPSRGWWPGGQLQSEGYYQKGKKHGSFRRWHLNEQMSSEGTYQNNLKEGVWKEWNKSGSLRSTTTYLMGFMNGARIFYDEKGNIVAEYLSARGKLIQNSDAPQEAPISQNQSPSNHGRN